MQATLHVGIAHQPAAGAARCCSCVAAPQRRRAARATARGVLRAAASRAVRCARAALRRDACARSPLAWNLSQMTLGVFRVSLAKDVLDEETWGEPDLVYYRDGLSTTVSVERWGRHYSLKNNGKVDASNGDDMPTQIMVAALPLLLHRAGARGLDVAVDRLRLGRHRRRGAAVPGAHVEVMELERAVVEASRFFADVNHLALRAARASRTCSVPRLRADQRRRPQLPREHAPALRRDRRRADQPVAHRRRGSVHGRPLPHRQAQAASRAACTASGCSSTS